MFLYHAGFMTAGFLVLLAGGAVARYAKRRRWWLRAHRGLGWGGVALVLAGFAAIFMGKGEVHFHVPHGWFGVVIVLLAVATPVLGHLSFIMREKSATLRLVHRWSGRTTLALMGLNILSGLFIAGIL